MLGTSVFNVIFFVLLRITSIVALNLVELTPLPEIVNLFHGCDIYLQNFYKDDFELTNLNEVQLPFKFYTDLGIFRNFWNVSTKNSAKIANLIPTGGKKVLPPSMFYSGNCKAEVVLAWTNPGAVHGLLFTIFDFTNSYKVLVHTESSRMDRSNAIQSSNRLLQSRTSFKSWFFDMHYFYHLITWISPTQGHYQLGIHLGSRVLEAKKYVLLSKCFYCPREHSNPNMIGESDKSILETMVHRVASDGVHDTHYNSFRHVLRSSIVRFIGLAEAQAYVLSVKRGPFKTYYTQIKEKEVLQGKKYMLLHESTTPEELMVFSLKTKFSNMSIMWPSTQNDLLSSFDSLSYRSGEFLAGPGYLGSRSLSTNVIPADNVGLAFVTSDNVTVTQRTGTFAAHFDRVTWVLTLICMLAAIAVLYLTTVKERRAGHSLDTVVFICRIFLENHHDVAEGARGTSKVYRALAVIVALVGMVMSSAWKGVLTSDLSSSPTYGGPSDLRQLVEQEWTMLPFISSRRPVVSARIYVVTKEELNDLSDAWITISHFIQVSTMAEKKFLKKGQRILDQYRRWVAPMEYPATDNWITCNMTRKAFWTLSTKSPSKMPLPKECLPEVRRNAFVVSQHRYGAVNVGWSLIGKQRPGEAFKAIKRLVETGVYNGLRAILTRQKEGYPVNDYVIKPLEPPLPMLTMTSPLVASAFDLWWKMLVAAGALLVIEGICGILRALFTLKKSSAH